jgi:hypothetical protein
VLWSYRSALIPGGYQVDAMCRLYIGLTFGFLEPAFLLLVLFACMYTVQRHSEEVGPNPNLFIFALTVGLTLPMCAAQVFAALFSRCARRGVRRLHLRRAGPGVAWARPTGSGAPPRRRRLGGLKGLTPPRPPPGSSPSCATMRTS